MSRSTRPGRSRPPAVEREGQRVAVAEKSGWAGSTPCQTISGGWPAALAREERPAPQDRMGLPQRDHHPDEPEEVGVSLRSDQSTQLVALSWHQALLLPCWVRRNSSPPRIIGTPCEIIRVAIRLRTWRPADREDVRVVGRPLDAAVPAPVVVAAVAVPLAVGLVVLLVVGDQVVEREAVVAGDEVDRVERPSALVEVVAAAEPRGQGRGHARVAAPEAPDVVAVPAIPVRPAPSPGKVPTW